MYVYIYRKMLDQFFINVILSPFLQVLDKKRKCVRLHDVQASSNS